MWKFLSELFDRTPFWIVLLIFIIVVLTDGIVLEVCSCSTR